MQKGVRVQKVRCMNKWVGDKWLRRVQTSWGGQISANQWGVNQLGEVVGMANGQVTGHKWAGG